ncbi:MAG: glycosyl hydrolase [Byssovorax sp.]
MRHASLAHRAPILRLGGSLLAAIALLAGAPACTTGGATPEPSAGGAGGSGSTSSVTVGEGGSATSGGGGAPSTSTTVPASFRTLSTSQYLSATNGGGSTLTATAAAAGPSETFTLTDLDGGALLDGDEVRIAASSGQYVSAKNGGGETLDISASTPGDNETFVITRLAGPATIATGDLVAFKTRLEVDYISAIDGGGGEVRADAPWAKGWETFTIRLDGKDPPPTTKSARQKVLDYLAGISGNKTVAGQQNKFNSDPAGATQQLQTITGKTPGLWSADFGFGQDAVDNRAKMIGEAKKQWSDGAIVQIMYHNCVPTRDELCSWDDVGGKHPQHLSDDEWSQLVTDGTDLNKAWKGRLDTLSAFFADLKSAGVAPLFRPLHEMNQGAFWWGGRGGSTGTRKLWQLTHDYLTKTKGFDNIVWVWDVQDFVSLDNDIVDYNPGTDYFDVAALDMYDVGYIQHNYDLMLGAAAGKPIAIGECEQLPTSDLLLKQPKWAFFMLWPDFIDENKGVLPGLYGAPNVITEDQMPGWK